MGNPTKSGINLAAPFWGNDHDDHGDFTNDGVTCPDHSTSDANTIKDAMKKLTARPRCSPPKNGDPCDPEIRKLGFDCMDKDGSGTITTKEVEEQMEADGAPAGEAAMIVGMFDENGDGTITAKEFNDAGVHDVGLARHVHRALGRGALGRLPQVVPQQVKPLLAKRADLVKMSDLHDMCTEHSSDTSQCAKSCTSK